MNPGDARIRIKSNDAGFGMVELLIALAIAAGVALGIGALIAFGTQLHERTNLVAAIESRLVELSALSATLERLSASDISRAEAEALHLRKGIAAADPELTILLRQDHLLASVTTADGEQPRGPEVARIDLAAFDAAKLEYLVRDGVHHAWTAETSGSTVLMARLVVSKRHRSWPVVLWTQPSAGSSP